MQHQNLLRKWGIIIKRGGMADRLVGGLFDYFFGQCYNKGDNDFGRSIDVSIFGIFASTIGIDIFSCYY